MSRKNTGPQTPEGYSGPLDISSIGAPSAPQVNLLPPEVKSRQAIGGIRLRAALLVVLVLAVLTVITVFTMFSLADAEAEVVEKEARVQALQTEMTQYSEVPQVKGQLQEARTAREFAMSGEFLWQDYMRAIQAVAPDDWTLTDFAATIPLPMNDPQVSANPIAAPSVATITFTGRALTLPDVAAWLEGMAEIPGFSDPYFSSAQVTEEDGTIYYDTTATVEVTDEALVSRFAPTEEEGGE